MLVLDCLLIILLSFWWWEMCCDSPQYKGSFSSCYVNMSAPVISRGLAGIPWLIIFSFGWVCWKLRHAEQFLCAFQYHHLCLSNKLIHIPGVWFSLFQCDLDGAALMPVFFFLKTQVLLHTSPWEWFHQSLPCHLEMSSIFYVLWYLVFVLWPAPHNVLFYLL